MCAIVIQFPRSYKKQDKFPSFLAFSDNFPFYKEYWIGLLFFHTSVPHSKACMYQRVVPQLHERYARNIANNGFGLDDHAA